MTIFNQQAQDAYAAWIVVENAAERAKLELRSALQRDTPQAELGLLFDHAQELRQHADAMLNEFLTLYTGE